MKNFMQYFHSVSISGLIAVLIFTQTAFAQTAIAQEPSAQTVSQSTQTPPATARQPAPIERQNPSGAAALTPEAQARNRLLSAHTIYVARSTQDANFHLSPDDAYNLVLASLRNWGRYQIVDSVAQADLVLQLRDAVHVSVVDDTNDTPITYYTPSFQLTVADPSTLAPIWSVSSSIPTAIKRKNQSSLLSAAATSVVSQLKLLAGDQLSPQDQAAQKQIAHYYRSRIGLTIGLAAAGAAVTVALIFVLRHRQADFCKAHNISPCAGS
jgi:hypothetical protein